MAVSDQYFDAAPDAIVVVSSDGTIVSANARCRPLLGFEPGDLIGRPVETLVPEHQRSGHIAMRHRFAISPHMRTMGDPRARLQALTASGELIPVDIALSPLEMNGEIMVMAVLRDVSDRVAAEAEIERIRAESDRRLRASEAAFRSAFDDAAVPMAILDLSDPDTQTIVRANESLGALLGMTVDELAGTSSVDLSHPDERAQHVAGGAALAAGRPTIEAEIRLRRSDGSYRWASVNTSRLTVDGDCHCLVHLVDITRRIEAERERDRREDLLRGLAAVRKAVLDERPPDEILQMVVEAVRRALDVELAFVALPGADGELEVRASHDADPWDLAGATLPADSVAARVMKTSEIELVPTPNGLAPLVGGDGGQDQKVGSIVVVPLHTVHSIEGILAMARTPDAAPFTESDLTMAQSLAAEAAVSLVLARARADKRRMLLVEDRERIARDLHDVVIQRLYATGMRLQVATSRVDLLAERAHEAVSDLDDTIDSVRNAIFQLSQPDDTVGGELRRLIDRLRVTSRSQVELTVTGDVESLPSVVVNHLLPTVNEMLSNVERHAQASTAQVSVAVDDDQLTVVVTDDGIGLQPGVAQGFGLRNLTKRAMALGGSLDYSDSARQTGSEFRWSVPLDTV